ncbi:hypothetical protein MRX96_037684 [Rhipicephalus microplus]
MLRNTTMQNCLPNVSNRTMNSPTEVMSKSQQDNTVYWSRSSLDMYVFQVARLVFFRTLCAFSTRKTRGL